MVATGVSMPAVLGRDAAVQRHHVGGGVRSAPGAGGLAPLQRWPNSLQRKLAGGPSGESSVAFMLVSNRPESGGAEQSSSFVTITMIEEGVGAQEALVLGGRAAAVGAERARDRGELVLEAAARSRPARRCRRTRRRGCRCSFDAGAVVGDERRARTRGRSGKAWSPAPPWPAYWKTPVLAAAAQAVAGAATRDRSVARAQVGADDREVEVGQPGRVFEPAHQASGSCGSLVLERRDGRRVVDHEQDVDVA